MGKYSGNPEGGVISILSMVYLLKKKRMPGWKWLFWSRQTLILWWKRTPMDTPTIDHTFEMKAQDVVRTVFGAVDSELGSAAGENVLDDEALAVFWLSSISLSEQ